MKAIVVKENGAPESMKYDVWETPTLTEGKDEILIEVKTSGLNGADLLQRRGLYPPPKDASPLLGLEVSGLIVELSDTAKAKGLSLGMEVMALLSGGGYAEKVKVRWDQVMPIPSGVSLQDAGGIPEVFLTAFLELCVLGQIQSGERVLIHAGASGVGTAAIQIAKSFGLEVWVTAGSQEKLEFCKSLGADVAINYKIENFAERIKESGRGVDCILDLVGASHLASNIKALATDGRLLLVGLSGGAKAELDLREVLSKRIRIIGSTLRARSLDDKANLIKAFWADAEDKFRKGIYRPVIDKVFAAEEVVEAHRYMESHQNQGKILLKWR